MSNTKLSNSNKSTSFSKEKTKLISKVKSLMKEYERFTKKVSPKNWRTTGGHISGLRNMKEEMRGLSKITNKEKENDWVKKSLAE